MTSRFVHDCDEEMGRYTCSMGTCPRLEKHLFRVVNPSERPIVAIDFSKCKSIYIPFSHNYTPLPFELSTEGGNLEYLVTLPSINELHDTFVSDDKDKNIYHTILNINKRLLWNEKTPLDEPITIRHKLVYIISPEIVAEDKLAMEESAKEAASLKLAAANQFPPSAAAIDLTVDSDKEVKEEPTRKRTATHSSHKTKKTERESKSRHERKTEKGKSSSSSTTSTNEKKDKKRKREDHHEEDGNPVYYGEDGEFIVIDSQPQWEEKHCQGRCKSRIDKKTTARTYLCIFHGKVRVEDLTGDNPPIPNHCLCERCMEDTGFTLEECMLRKENGSPPVNDGNTRPVCEPMGPCIKCGGICPCSQCDKGRRDVMGWWEKHVKTDLQSTYVFARKKGGHEAKKRKRRRVTKYEEEEEEEKTRAKSDNEDEEESLE